MRKGLLLLVFLFSGSLFAQQPPAAGAGAEGDSSGQDTNYEGGIVIGDLLPSQIPGLTEITGVGGVRGGYRLTPMAVAEAAFIAGNGSGAEYKNLAASVRLDVPIESFVGFMVVGLDITNYKGAGLGAKTFGGGHMGGGIMTQLGGALWIRSDMKFTFNPGISMNLNFSLLFRI